MTLGARIAKQRKKLGLSQEALGNELGVSRQAIYKWESDGSVPEIDKLIALSKRFGVTIGWLLGIEEELPQLPKQDTDELTETQLRVVEEIVSRYLSAQPKLPKPKRWPWILAVLALLSAFFAVYDQLDQVSWDYRDLRRAVDQIEYNVDTSIDGISYRVEEILEAQNQLVSDSGVEIAATNLRENTITFSVHATPKTFQDGMVAEFIADYGEGTSSAITVVEYDNARYSGEVTCPLTDTITISACFITSDGIRSTQKLSSFENLYSTSFPVLSFFGGDTLLWGRLAEKDGSFVFSAGEEDFFQIDHSYWEHAAELHSIRVGLFYNQTLVSWLTPVTHSGPDCYQFEEDVYLTLSEEDIITFAAVVEDDCGRIVVIPSDARYHSVPAETSTSLEFREGDWDYDPDGWIYE